MHLVRLPLTACKLGKKLIQQRMSISFFVITLFMVHSDTAKKKKVTSFKINLKLFFSLLGYSPVISQKCAPSQNALRWILLNIKNHSLKSTQEKNVVTYMDLAWEWKVQPVLWSSRLLHQRTALRRTSGRTLLGAAPGTGPAAHTAASA